jgi:hypothetical protein
MVQKNPPPKKRGRPRMYEWAKLFARKRFRMRSGVDYTCDRLAIIQQIRNAASAHGVSVKFEDESAGVVVLVSKEGADAPG